MDFKLWSDWDTGSNDKTDRPYGSTTLPVMEVEKGEKEFTVMRVEVVR